MFEGLAGLTIVRDSGVINPRSGLFDWVITMKTDHPIALRVTAHDDGYKNQSYLRFEKLTEGGWKVIAYRQGDELPVGAPRVSWADQWGSEIDDITLEGCSLLDLLGE